MIQEGIYENSEYFIHFGQYIQGLYTCIHETLLSLVSI